MAIETHNNSALLSGGRSDTAVILVRGVGDAAKDETLRSLTPILENYGLNGNHVREVNWSWAEFVAWPYLEKSDDAKEPGETSIPRVEFLRLLGFSVLNAASDPLPCRSAWANRLRLAVDATLWPARLLPVLIAIAPVLIALNFLSRPRALGLVSLLFLPFAIAVASLESQFIWATLRAVLLRIFWPVFFPIFVVLTYGWVPFVYLWVTFGIASAAGYLIPASWRYSLYSFTTNYKPDTFEESTLLKYLLFFGVLFGSAVAGAVILAVLAYLSRRFAPLLKVLADVSRYLGDSSYRRAVQCEFSTQLRELAQLGSRNLFIFAHSLGTVIAVDSLRCLYSENFDSIVLVTAGSPLRRFFWRFFRYGYAEPWALMAEVSRILGAKKTTFNWFNVFRRKDPVGGRLRLPPGHECAVPKSGETLLNAHLDYWTAKEIHQAIERFLK